MLSQSACLGLLHSAAFRCQCKCITGHRIKCRLFINDHSRVSKMGFSVHSALCICVGQAGAIQQSEGVCVVRQRSCGLPGPSREVFRQITRQSHVFSDNVSSAIGQRVQLASMDTRMAESGSAVNCGERIVNDSDGIAVDQWTHSQGEMSMVTAYARVGQHWHLRCCQKVSGLHDLNLTTCWRLLCSRSVLLRLPREYCVCCASVKI